MNKIAKLISILIIISSLGCIAYLLYEYWNDVITVKIAFKFSLSSLVFGIGVKILEYND